MDLNANNTVVPTVTGIAKESVEGAKPVSLGSMEIRAMIDVAQIVKKAHAVK